MPPSHRTPRSWRDSAVTVAGVAGVLVIGVLTVVAAREYGGGGSAPAERTATISTPAKQATVSPLSIVEGRPDPKLVVQPPPNANNPLAKRKWGVYEGSLEQSWPPYARASGSKKRLLGKIALTPKSKWFGSWDSVHSIGSSVRRYIAGSQHGDPNALVQFALFAVKPWEHKACSHVPSGSEQSTYRAWIRQVAAAIGNAPHVAIILQPDGPFTACAPHGSRISSSLISYASRTLSALDHTSVYIDAGAADWPADGGQGGAAAAVRFLIPDGVKYARGIALNSTHYSAVTSEVDRAVQIIKLLKRNGIPGKRAVINTSNSGHPFVFGSYRGKDPDNAAVCQSLSQHGTCVALGIPPTSDVGNPKWGLPDRTNQRALTYVDGYMWFGRPWLYRQSSPFQTSRALTLARVWKWG